MKRVDVSPDPGLMNPIDIRSVSISGRPVRPDGLVFTIGTLVTPDHLCPDLLRYEQIGAADNWRGRMVRGFFFLMRVWPVKS